MMFRRFQGWFADNFGWLYTLGAATVAIMLPWLISVGTQYSAGTHDSSTKSQIWVALAGTIIGFALLGFQHRVRKLSGLTVIVGLRLPGHTTFQIDAAQAREDQRRPRPLLVFKHQTDLADDVATWRQPLQSLQQVLFGFVESARRNHLDVRNVQIYLQTPLAAAFHIGRMLRYNAHADVTLTSPPSSPSPPEERGIKVGHPVRAFDKDFTDVRLDHRRLTSSETFEVLRLDLAGRRAQSAKVQESGAVWVTEEPGPASTNTMVALLAANAPALNSFDAVRRYADVAGAKMIAIEYVGQIPDTSHDIEKAIATMYRELVGWLNKQPHGEVQLVFATPAVIAAAFGYLLPKGRYTSLHFTTEGKTYAPVPFTSD